MPVKETDDPAPLPSSPPIDLDGDNSSDALSGPLFVVVGVAALTLAWNYPSGSAFDMGPGFLPLTIAALLILIGVAITARGSLNRSVRLPVFHWRAALWIAAAIIVFALSIGRLGLVAACMLTVFTSTFADRRMSWQDAFLATVGLAAFCGILFGYMLKVPVQMWPG